jgi:hypothetical protein
MPTVSHPTSGVGGFSSTQSTITFSSEGNGPAVTTTVTVSGTTLENVNEPTGYSSPAASSYDNFHIEGQVGLFGGSFTNQVNPNGTETTTVSGSFFITYTYSAVVDPDTDEVITSSETGQALVTHDLSFDFGVGLGVGAFGYGVGAATSISVGDEGTTISSDYNLFNSGVSTEQFQPHVNLSVNGTSSPSTWNSSEGDTYLSAGGGSASLTYTSAEDFQANVHYSEGVLSQTFLTI